ncbi:hypothetical protein CL630_00245 [bacterium]|nr:hypothetical protein [bacterium]|tara:strand:+ start:10801 stop:11070 length:270 start_codon:yes stop_codon:yes gene_type:complete
MTKYTVSHSYLGKDGVWHEDKLVDVKEGKFVDVGPFTKRSLAHQFIKEMNWVLHHREGDVGVYMYPGHLCNPPTEKLFLETEKMFLRRV